MVALILTFIKTIADLRNFEAEKKLGYAKMQKLDDKLEAEKTKVAELKKQIEDLHFNNDVQSIGNISQGIFRALLPETCSTWVNGGIQAYSGYCLVGHASRLSGIIFLGAIFIGLWETIKWFFGFSKKPNIIINNVVPEKDKQESNS